MNERTWGRIEVQAEALYLLNLLALPGIAFVLLVLLWHKHREMAAPLQRSHLDSAFRGSLLAGVLIVCVVLMMFYWGEIHNPYFWVMVVLYFTTVHASLVLLGVVGLAQALAGKPYYYPLIGGGRGNA